MKKDMFWKLLAVLAAAVLLPACQSDYTEEALQSAREYALKNTKMLPETARNYIRYATPVLQTAGIFAHRPMKLTEYDHLPRNVDYKARPDPKSAVILAQFVWNPPGLGYSVIAVGRSQADLSSWDPIRVVLKDIAPYRKTYETALKAAVNYVTDNMLYLSRMERVRVRTTEAEVRETDFDLEYMFEEQLESAQSEWKNFLDTLKEQRKKRQYSLVWKADDGKKRIVVTGFGSENSLVRWTPACGMVIPLSKLDEYTRKIEMKGPDQTGSPENDAK